MIAKLTKTTKDNKLAFVIFVGFEVFVMGRQP
jgi:hypothetical protein